MKLSKRLRKWKANLTTQTPFDYVMTLRADVNAFADEVKALESENAKLRSLVRKWYPHALRRVGRDALEQWGQMDIARDLGIEVEE